jgi:hypothetical protein
MRLTTLLASTALLTATLLPAARAQTAPITPATPIVPGPPIADPNLPRPLSDTEQAHALLIRTPERDYPKLAVCDKKYILHYAPHEEAERFFAAINSHHDEFIGATVISADANSIHVAVCEDAQKSHTADFLFRAPHPLTDIPSPGDTLTLTGAYTSYTSDPPLIVMTNAAIVRTPK